MLGKPLSGGRKNLGAYFQLNLPEAPLSVSLTTLRCFFKFIRTPSKDRLTWSRYVIGLRDLSFIKLECEEFLIRSNKNDNFAHGLTDEEVGGGIRLAVRFEVLLIYHL